MTVQDGTIRHLLDVDSGLSTNARAVIGTEAVYDFIDNRILGFHLRPAGAGTDPVNPSLIRAEMLALTQGLPLPLLFLIDEDFYESNQAAFEGRESGDFFTSHHLNASLIYITSIGHLRATSASRLIDTLSGFSASPLRDTYGNNAHSEMRGFLWADPSLIINLESDLMKQFQLRSMEDHAAKSSLHLIAPGIRSASQTQKLRDLKIRFATGPFLQPVQLAGCLSDPDSGITVGDLSAPVQYVDAALSGSELEQLFAMNDSLPGVCVFEDERLSGVVTRELLYEKMSGRYGFGLFANRSIQKIMKTEFLTVDAMTSVEAAARLAMQRPSNSLYDFITVTRDGEYCGVVTIRDLISHMTGRQTGDTSFPRQIGRLSRVP